MAAQRDLVISVLFFSHSEFARLGGLQINTYGTILVSRHKNFSIIAPNHLTHIYIKG